MAQTPIAVNLICCEQIIVEEKTRNITFVNSFVSREARTFPTDKISFVVFATITDGVGKMPLEVVILQLESMEEIHRDERMIELRYQLHQLGVRFSVQDCVFPAPGYYEVSLFANQEMISRRRILLKERN